MKTSKSPHQLNRQYDRETRAAIHDQNMNQIQSQPGRGRQPGHRQGQGKAHNFKPEAGANVEEGSKLNMLIEEYRKENDRCSKRINELQKKLNKSAGRHDAQPPPSQPVEVDLPQWLVNRIRTETTAQQ